MEGEFEIFYWGGQKRYRCNQYWETGAKCQYDTYDREALIRHISQPHSESGKRKKSAPPPPRTVVSPILGPDGKQIVHEAKFKEE
jgi:hypothetical protein